MEKIRIDCDNVLNPDAAFRSYLNKLIPIYVADYGYNNKNLIQERIKKAIYLFDSLPIDEINFIVEYGDELQCPEKARSAYDECRDFINKKKVIDEKVDKKFYNILADAYGAGNRYLDELFTMEIDYYGLEMQLALASDDTPIEFKDEIRKKQEEYVKDCEILGVRCITDYRIIDRLFEMRDAFDYEKNLLLAKNTKYVKRMKKQIFNKSGFSLNDEQLVDLLFYSKTAACSIVDVGRKNKLTICYFPLAKNIMISRVDGNLFHEMRHVIETCNHFSGIQDFNSDKYFAMNEIRTEVNVLHDMEILKGFPLFSSDDYVENTWNPYVDAFYYTEGFFEEHRETLNKLAIKNNVKELERLYGRKNLRLYDGYLKNVIDAFCDESYLYKELYDEEKQKSLVRSLNEHYKSRQ